MKEVNEKYEVEIASLRKQILFLTAALIVEMIAIITFVLVLIIIFSR